MSSKTIGRNDPCPCGSGKKFKACCLKQRQQTKRTRVAEASAREHRNEALPLAITWIQRRHPGVLDALVEGFYEPLPEAWRPSSTDEEQHLFYCAMERALAEGEFPDPAGGDEVVRLRDLVLAPGGPLLDETQRRWLEASTARRLGLYRIRDVAPGSSMTLENLLDEEEPPILVEEAAASQTLQRGDHVGARLAQWDGHWELCIAYPLGSGDVLRLLEVVRQNFGRLACRDDAEAAFVSDVLTELWVASFAPSAEPPELLGPDGDPILLITDHWDVLDWEALEERLAGQPDVQGSRSENGWVRLEDPGEATSRSLLAINVEEGTDRIETFAMSRDRAETGRVWFHEVAGDAVSAHPRETDDPKE